MAAEKEQQDVADEIQSNIDNVEKFQSDFQRRVAELEALKIDETKGQVVRSKAANELAQLLSAKDDTPLNRMKMTQAALLKKRAPLLETAKAARQVAAKAREPFDAATKLAVAAREKADAALGKVGFLKNSSNEETEPIAGTRQTQTGPSGQGGCRRVRQKKRGGA